MRIHFTKMHGAGNDYIYIDCFSERIENPEKLAVSMSDRHFGIGGDGIVLIMPSKVADARMRMFNADGSEGKMCGNAIRCVGKYLYDNGMVKEENVSIETESGIKKLLLKRESGVCIGAAVNMGRACFVPEMIPVKSESEFVQLNGYSLTSVSMGNPHCVLFTKDTMGMDIALIAEEIQHSEVFPEGVNVGFAQVDKDTNSVLLRVYERGSGETYACGTGACACVAAAVHNGLLDTDIVISVKLKGGTLEIVCDKDYSLTMTGSAVTVFDGSYEY